MPFRCNVIGCGAETGVDGVKLFKFPDSMKIRQLWIEFVGRSSNWCPNKYSKICDRHFIDGKPTSENPNPTIMAGSDRKTRNSFATDLIGILGINKDSEPIAGSATIETEFTYDPTSGESTADIISVIQKLPKRKAVSAPSTPSKKIKNLDHCYLEKLSIAPEKKKPKDEISITLSSNDSSAPLATSSQPSELLKTFMKKNVRRRRMKVGDLPVSKLRSLVLKYVKRAKLYSKKLVQKFSWSDIQNDDERTAFYTFFPSYETLFRIFDGYIKGDAEKKLLENGKEKIRDHKRRLKIEDEFLMVLIKLRLNLPHRLLADMFGISMTQCVVILQMWIRFLAPKFSKFVYWVPMSRRSPPPAIYEGFSDCVAIIDCFEIRTEKPSNLRNARQSWSEYKQNETAKILIAVSPRGTILYLSEPWGGRVSDKEIVQQDQTFLNLLKREKEPGTILADRGFRGLSDFLPLATNKLLLMPLQAGKGKKMTKAAVEISRKRSNLRINVERTIGQLRCFKILKHDFYMSRLYQLKDILPICAGVINLRPPLVK